MSALTYKLKHALPYICIVVFVFVLMFGISTQDKPRRIGDGSEYYLMYYAFSADHTPWASDKAFAAYDELFKSNRVEYLASVDGMRTFLPALVKPEGRDFPHFWFYSFLAYICSVPFLVLGHIGASSAFVLLHSVLLSIMFCIAYRYYKFLGLIVATIFTFFSPLLWFTNKLHTELFTFALCMSGVMLVHKKKYLVGSLFFAIASTQNLSFALVAFIPFCYGIIHNIRKRYSFVDLVLIFVIAGLVLMHPVYYLYRIGVYTPQVLVGGANLGVNLGNWYVWFIDPDVGLFANWPLGFLQILAIIPLLFFSRKYRDILNLNWFEALFLTLFLCLNIYAHSSTTNLNSGGTVDIARYAIWYIPILLPFSIALIAYIAQRRLLLIIGIALLIPLAILNVSQYSISRNEEYLSPTSLSHFVQKHMSWLYNPPAEIFAERYCHTEGAFWQFMGVVGPDDKKVLLWPSKNKDICAPNYRTDNAKVINFLKKTYPDVIKPVYVNLPSDMDFKTYMAEGFNKIGTNCPANKALISGWSNPEDWGIWSCSHNPVISISCTKQFLENKDSLKIKMSLMPFAKPQRLTIRNKDRVLYNGVVKVPRDEISFTVPLISKEGSIILDLEIPDAFVPPDSSDLRLLGIGVLGITIN